MVAFSFYSFSCSEVPFMVFMVLLGFILIFYGNFGLTLNSYFSMDLFGAMMVLLTVLVFFISVLAIFFEKFFFHFWFYLVLLLFGLFLFLLFLFSSMSSVLFYVFFELTVIPTFIIILGWGYSLNRIQASFYMIVYMLFASYPFLISLLHLKSVGYFYSFLGAFYFVHVGIPIQSGFWSYLLLLIFMVKLPLFLVHLWLPKAHVDAPLLGSMVLAGVLLKMGGFGIMKMFLFTWFSLLKASWLLSFFSLVGSLYMSIVCVRQLDLKSLIAYSSIVHMGPVFCCFFLLSYYSLVGSFLLMISHGLCSCGLFFLFNSISSSHYSRSLYMVRGLVCTGPICSYFWFSFCFFNMGCPPTFNFFSEVISFLSCLMYGEFLLLILFTLMFFVAVYCVTMMVSVSHGSSVGQGINLVVSLSLCELIVMSFLFFSIFFSIFFLSFFMC